jgi:hypothetical protein
MEIIQQGETSRIWVMARDSANAGVTGVTIDISIRRDSDGFWWNGTTFTSAHSTDTFTEVDGTNLPGLYYYDFRPGVSDFTGVMMAETADAAVENDPWAGAFRVGSWVDNIDVASSSLATAADMQEVKKRLGSVMLDNALQTIRVQLGQILQLVK